MSESVSIHKKAQRHLARCDEVLKRLIGLVGPCTLTQMDNRFASLVRAIIAQQISTKAAAAITGRLNETVASMTPEAILAMPREVLRQVGLSEAKTRALIDLAEKVHDGSVPLDHIDDMDDETVIQTLIPVRGIGRWTAEMFLIFSLGRLDVLPVDDWGLRAGVQRHYRMRKPPIKERLTKLAEPWRPFRSIGTWYIWRSFGNVIQSQAKPPSS